MQFTATFIEPSTGRVTANLVFADPETNPDEPSVLMLSRCIEFEDTIYYFEINDQSYSSYGGLDAVRLTRNRLELRVDADVVEKFEREDFAEVVVDFQADDKLYEVIRQTLATIIEDPELLSIE